MKEISIKVEVPASWDDEDFRILVERVTYAVDTELYSSDYRVEVREDG